MASKYSISITILLGFFLIVHPNLAAAEQGGHGGRNAQKLATGMVESVLEFEFPNSPEGIASDRRGNIYVGKRFFEGELLTPPIRSEILKIATNGTVSIFATLPRTENPIAAGVLGLATDPRGTVYAAHTTFMPDTQGVYRIARDGSEPERLQGSEGMVFPNALTFDRRGNLYVTDSVVGAIWRCGRHGGCELWIQDDALLGPLPEDPFGFPLPGANGIAFFPPNHLYVANTEKSLIAQVDIRRDGSPSLLPWAVANVFIPDGIAMDARGDIHVAIPPGGSIEPGVSPLVKVDPRTGHVTDTVIGLEAFKFNLPTSLTFGQGRRNNRSVFVTNSALFGPIPGFPGPGVVEVGVGVPGFRGR